MPSVGQLLQVGSMVVADSRRLLSDVVESRIEIAELRWQRHQLPRRWPILKGGVDPIADEQMPWEA